MELYSFMDKNATDKDRNIKKEALISKNKQR